MSFKSFEISNEPYKKVLAKGDKAPRGTRCRNTLLRLYDIMCAAIFVIELQGVVINHIL